MSLCSVSFVTWSTTSFVLNSVVWLCVLQFVVADLLDSPHRVLRRLGEVLLGAGYSRGDVVCIPYVGAAGNMEKRTEQEEKDGGGATLPRLMLTVPRCACPFPETIRLCRPSLTFFGVLSFVAHCTRLETSLPRQPNTLEKSQTAIITLRRTSVRY
jgi:hypothetical protein